MLVDCLSCCSEYAAAFGRLGGVLSLVLWSTKEGKKGNNRKENQIQNDDAKFFDKNSVLFCTVINFDEKFACIDMQYSSVGAVPRIVIVCSSRSHMLRYELSPIDRSLPSNGTGASEWDEWECSDFMDIDMPDLSVLRIVLSGTAEMSATFECAAGNTDGYEKKQLVVVRSELLRRIRAFNCSQYSSVVDLIFHGEDLLFTAFEKGRILGWSVRNDALIFDCDVLQNKSTISHFAVVNAKYSGNLKYSGDATVKGNRSNCDFNGPGDSHYDDHDDYDDGNDGNSVSQCDVSSVSFILGSCDGRLKLIEVNISNTNQSVSLEIGSLDLQRDTRYLDCIGEMNQNKEISSNFSNSADDYRSHEKNGKNILRQNHPAPAVRKESSFIPIAIKYFSTENTNTWEGNIAFIRNTHRGGDKLLRNEGGMLLVATCTALLLITSTPLQLVRHVPLSALSAGSLSVGTISAARVCCIYAGGTGGTGGSGGSISVMTLMMTAFERRAVSYPIYIERAHTTTKTVTNKLSNTTTPPTTQAVTRATTRIVSEAHEMSPTHGGRQGERQGEKQGISVSSDTNSDYEGEEFDEREEEEDHSISREGEGADAPKEKRSWKFPPPADTPLHLREFERRRTVTSDSDDDHDGNADNIKPRSDDNVRCERSEKQENISVYADPSVPLSLFLADGIKALSSSPLTPRESKVQGPDAKKLTAPARVKGSWEEPAKDKTGRLVDQPVTFRATLRSSGYGQPMEKKVSGLGGAGVGRKMSGTGVLMRSASLSSPSALSSSAAKGSSSSSSGGGRLTNHSSTPGPRLRQYPRDCGAMTQHQAHNDYPPKGTTNPSPIYGITYSSDGSQLALATSDTAVSTLKLPVARNVGEGQCFLGHNGRVTGVCFSHDKKMLLSSSTDGTAIVWAGVGGGGGSSGGDSPAVVISHTKRQPSASTTSSTSVTIGSGKGNSGNLKGNGLGNGFGGRGNVTKVSSFSCYNAALAASKSNTANANDTRNRPFGAEISSARFFYMDKFIVLAVKASVNMYTYQNDRDGDSSIAPKVRAKSQSFSLSRTAGTLTSIGDLKKQRSTGSFERQCEWRLSPAQSVTALACVNSLLSPIMLCATSDRKLHVLDAAVGCIARTSDCAHEKAVHCIALPTPSIHSQVSSDSYNLFATAATDNVVSLWDLRAPSVVFRYTGHINRREQISVTLSPCLRYLATGSEDRTARIIDVRGGAEIAKLQGHRDVVSGVAFNPLFSQLATCSFDGAVRFYVDPTGDASMPGV